MSRLSVNRRDFLRDISSAPLIGTAMAAEPYQATKVAANKGSAKSVIIPTHEFFGNLDERRVVWSHNRDLIMNPKQDGDPVNALPKAYVEVDGKVLPETTGWVRKLTYK